MAINNVMVSGRLVKDAELKEAGGNKLLTFTLAVNEYQKDKDDYVNFFDVNVWGGRATYLSKHLVKGVLICVSGKLRQDRWEKDGKKNSKIKITGNDVEVLKQKEQQFANNNNVKNEDLGDLPF